MNGPERPRCGNCEKPAWRGGEKDFERYAPFCSWGCQQEARERRIDALDSRRTDALGFRVKPWEAPMGSCDWGGCDNLATAWRLSSTHGWLPVCFVHGERKPEVEKVARNAPEPKHLFEGDATEAHCDRCGGLWEEHPSFVGGGADEWRRQTR